MADTDLMREIADLRHRVLLEEDREAIRRLHFAYGYYMDRLLFEDVVDLYSDDCELHFMGGVFLGKAGARRLYCGRLGTFAGRSGLLIDHLMLQDIVDVAPDRSTARARFRCLVQGGVHETIDMPAGRRRQYWHAGIYENGYVREDGIWKISLFGYNTVWEADYEKGWGYATPDGGSTGAIETLYPEDPFGPDRIEPVDPLFPLNRTVPFHYAHPVTGAPYLGDRPVRRE